jgi:hypothetical protein
VFDIAIGNTSTGNTLDTTSCSGNHSNISIGEGTGCSLTNTCNVLIGYRTGVNVTSGKRNVLIGAGTGSGSPQTGNDNIKFGRGSGGSLTSGSSNIIMGDNTTYSLNTGCCNIILGSMVGDDVSSGSENIILGNRGGYQAGNGSKNVFLGACARPSASGASNCLIIANALNDRWIIGDSNYSVGIGITNPSIAKVGPEDTQTFAAGIVTAYQISAAFFSAGCNNGFGGNIAIGNSFTGNISTNNTGHSRAIAFGNNAGCQDTGHNHTFIGDQAGKNVVAGDDNIVIGGCALGKSISNVCSSNNIIMGEDAAPVAQSTSTKSQCYIITT